MGADSGLDIGRRIKARRIADTIRSLGGDAHEARQFSETEWLLYDKLSRKRIGREDKPPSEVTRALVIEYLAKQDDSPRDEDIPPK
jgi:hypothetical protein